MYIFVAIVISITMMYRVVVTATAFVIMCDFVSHAVWESYRRKCQKYNPKYINTVI